MRNVVATAHRLLTTIQSVTKFGLPPPCVGLRRPAGRWLNGVGPPNVAEVGGMLLGPILLLVVVPAVGLLFLGRDNAPPPPQPAGRMIPDD
jgi:hypothetical protein